MRGLAAFVVIADHVPSDIIGKLVPGRYLAVDFFFVLSGFVLAHAYGQRLAGGLSPLAFLKARLIRFYPLYIAGLVPGAIMAFIYLEKGWTDGDPSRIPGALAFNVLFLPCPPSLSPLRQTLFPFDGPAWSLFFELAVNSVYAVLATRLFGLRIGVFLTAAAAFLIFTAFSFGKLDGGWGWENVSGGAARVTFSFFAGVALYRLRARCTLPGLPPVLAFAMLALVFAVPAEGVWRTVFDLAATLAIFPAFVALSANSEGGVLETRIYSIIGMLSYGVYVLHVPVYRIIETSIGAVFHVQMAALGDGAPLLVAFAAALAAGVAHKLYDVPARRWLSRRMQFAPPALN